MRKRKAIKLPVIRESIEILLDSMENTGKKQFRKKKAKRLLIRSKSVKIPESFNN